MKTARDKARRLAMPTHLTAFAAEEWQRLAPAARRAGTLSTATVRSFELLVETLATERKARELVDRDGITVETGRGGVSRTRPCGRWRRPGCRQRRCCGCSDWSPASRQPAPIHKPKNRRDRHGAAFSSETGPATISAAGAAVPITRRANLRARHAAGGARPDRPR